MWVLPALIMKSMWGVGGQMLIYLAALQSIPTQLHEAAELDGANALRRFWHVSIPMITPVILFNLVMGIIASFQVFTGIIVCHDQRRPKLRLLLLCVLSVSECVPVLPHGLRIGPGVDLFLIILVFTAITMRS